MVPGSPAVLQLLRLIAAVSMLAVAGVALRERDSVVGRPFALLVVSHAAWSVLVFGSAVLDPGTRILEVGIGLAITVAAVSAPAFWLLYALDVTGRRRFLTRRRYIVLGVTTAGIPVLVGLRSLGGESVLPVAAWLYWVTLLLLLLWIFGLLVVGTYLLLQLAGRYRQVSYRQVGVLTVALLAPYVFSIASTLSRPTGPGETTDFLPIDITFVGFLIAAVGFGVAIERYPIFTAFPEADHVARADVLEELTVALFILDTDDRILDANAEAVRLCEQNAESVIGTDIHDVLGGLAPLPTAETARLSLATADGQRRYEVTGSTVTDASDGTIGRTVLLRDITDRQTREQQLEVLTRVLRHNLRNDLDTILAHVEEIDDPALRERIAAEIETTQRTGRKARAVETVLAASHEQRHEVDLSEIIGAVADERRQQHDGCAVTVKTPASIAVVSHEQLLRRLLTEVVENGLEHATVDQPAVDVSIVGADERTDTLSIVVADNGPGIPDHEYETLDAGTETPLKHGSGIGLWIVNWIVDYLGAELSFKTTGDTGTTVRITLHGTPVVDSSGGEKVPTDSE